MSIFSIQSTPISEEPLLSSCAGSNSVLFHFVEEGGPGDPQGGSGFYLVALGIFQGTDNIN